MYLKAVFRASIIKQTKEKEITTENQLPVHSTATYIPKWAAARKETVRYYPGNA